MSADSEPEERVQRRLQIATELLGLAYTIYVMWVLLIPEHQRRLVLMRVTEAIRSAAGRAAFRTGHRAMSLEISASVENYELPYRLSLVRDRAAVIYEKLRYTA